MGTRTPRRLREDSALEDMSDDELQELRFFGNLVTDPETVILWATEAEQARAAEILRERSAQ